MFIILLFLVQFWLGWLQHIVMAYFWCADVVKLWQDLTVIKPCSLTLGERKKKSFQNQNNMLQATPRNPLLHRSTLIDSIRDKSDWCIQLVSCCSPWMGDWCFMLCYEWLQRQIFKSNLRVLGESQSLELAKTFKSARWNWWRWSQR